MAQAVWEDSWIKENIKEEGALKIKIKVRKPVKWNSLKGIWEYSFH